MALIRWNPWHEIDTLQRQFDSALRIAQLSRIAEDAFVPATRSEWKSFTRVPAVELEETTEAILMKVELPGIDVKDLDVQVTEDTVSIQGERKSETRSEDHGVMLSEFQYGTFQRVISLPVRIQNTQVQAEYKDGILKLNLPKVTEEKHKVVKVNLGDRATAE